jgi:hypothetical protein
MNYNIIFKTSKVDTFNFAFFLYASQWNYTVILSS